MNATKEQVDAAIKQTMAIADAIRELREVPSGHLYARVMQFMTLTSYTSILEVLKRAKLIKVEHNVVTWIGPTK